MGVELDKFLSGSGSDSVFVMVHFIVFEDFPFVLSFVFLVGTGTHSWESGSLPQNTFQSWQIEVDLSAGRIEFPFLGVKIKSTFQNFKNIDFWLADFKNVFNQLTKSDR